MTLKQFAKELKILFGSFRFNWKVLFLFNNIDIRKDDEKGRKTKRIVNAIVGGIFCTIAILLAVSKAPDFEQMISSFFLVAFLYIGLCSIMNALQIKNNNSGRKSKEKIGSFQELFISPSDFNTIDSFVRNHYSPEMKMTTRDCHCLLEIIIDNQMVRDNSMDPMVTLFCKQYPSLLPKKTNRAFTKAKYDHDKKKKMKEELFQNSSKK